MLRAIGGIAMGLTSIALVCSPWGQRSGGHMNPALTLTFFSLGKISWRDAVAYVIAQFAGGILGIQVAALLIGAPLAHGGVNYVATTPGKDYGVAAAFGAEMLISGLLMLVVLYVSNSCWLSRFTPAVAGSMVALYIWIESPVSGMSMNPARTLGSAIAAQEWTALWIYFVAPLTGMLAAGQLYARSVGIHRILCAKLHHHNSSPCIFRCNFSELE
ncbi:MAG: aquaporin [Bryobacteraceae bacterium]|nr:aquaporin [Bryobacteraceae bacterium]